MVEVGKRGTMVGVVVDTVVDKEEVQPTAVGQGVGPMISTG